MKKLILFFALLLSSLGIYSQNFIETVHLKNGSIIRGVIIEQIPNESLKLKTQDGNLFVFQIDEISKITKDISSNSLSNSSNSKKDKGYRGFADFAYSVGVGDYSIDRLEFSTSHGYQFNPYLYLGIGAGVNYFYDFEIASIPLFVNPRVDFPTGKINPFLDLKIGYTVSSNIQGFYLSPSIGARFSLQNQVGLNLGIGYTMQNIEGSYYDGYNFYYGHVNIGAITFKLGLDF